MRSMLTRSRLLANTTTAFASVESIRTVRAAQFVYKYGIDVSVSDPVNVRAVQMASDIKRETNGRLQIDVYPNSQLGSTQAMLEQTRLGAVQFGCTGSVLSALVPAITINDVLFAFKSYKQVLDAEYGDLGAALRKEVALKLGFHVFPIVRLGGFHQITSSTHPIQTADDFTGFKIRTVASPTLVETFKTLGAQVATVPIGELYTALQTRLVDGEETP